MARIPERKFDPARPVVARKYFTANGRKYVPGAQLDWRSASISQRRVMQMFDAGKLKHDDEVIVEDKKVVESAPEPVEFTVEDKLPDQGDHWHYVDEPDDDLDRIDDMKELRRIADEIGAPYKVSKADQRQAIRNHRKEIEE